ncbi:MAG: calcium-binding protein [Paracoccaceae bacterium]
MDGHWVDGLQVTGDHFGTNFLFHNEGAKWDVGESFSLAADAAEVTTLRYPGGTIAEQYFDLTDPNRKSGEDFFGVEGRKNLVQLDEFLSYCHDNGHDAIIVIPVARLFDASTGKLAETVTVGEDEDGNPVTKTPQEIIAEFITTVSEGPVAEGSGLDPFEAGLIRAFEIGNEFGQDNFVWSVAEYARLQAEIAQIIDNVLDDYTWSSAAPEPDIFIQAGRHETMDGMQYSEEDTNALLIAGFAPQIEYTLSDEEDGAPTDETTTRAMTDQEIADGVTADADAIAIDIIDGVVTHTYYSIGSGDPMRWQQQYHSRFDTINTQWQDAGFNVDLVITEWNIGANRPETTPVSGLMRSAQFLNAFAGMLYYDVDVASLWSAISPGSTGQETIGVMEEVGGGPRHGGHDNDVFRLTPTGYLYQMMSTSLQEAALVGGSIDDSLILDPSDESKIGYQFAFQDVERSGGLTAYQNDYTIFLVSGTDDVLDLTVDLGAYMSADSYVYTTTLGLADPTADPTDYFAHGAIRFDTNLQADADGVIVFDTLNAFETLQVHIVTGEGVDIHADAQNAIDDLLRTTHYEDTVFGYGGDDELRTRRGDDIAEGGAGNDLIYGGSGNDTLDGGVGNDTIYGEGDNDSIIADNGNDLIDAGEGNDSAEGGAGNDLIYGGSGNDTLDGGVGHDTIYGEGDNDSIIADNGNDLIDAGEGDDFINAGNGNDTVDGGAGGDLVKAYDGADLIFGGDGDDRLFGGTQYDTIYGGAGSDRIWGGNGRDVVEMGDGNDYFNDDDQHGQHGGDRVDGGNGNDWMRAGGGNDTLTGGAGVDVFVFSNSGARARGWDEVTDFTAEDRLRLDDALWGGGAFDSSNAAQVDANVHLTLSENLTIVFWDQLVADITSSIEIF